MTMQCCFHKVLLGTIVLLLTSTNVRGQMLFNGAWTQKNQISIKVSQLFYELNVGINICPQRKNADFLYFAFGYGKPTKSNAWRKFLPEKKMPENLTKPQQVIFSNSGIDDLHGGKIGVGWNHWFNHMVGFYLQANWGFIADLSNGDDLPDDIAVLLESAESKGVFVYNTVPVEMGLTLNFWKHYLIQGGVTYMWKEIPLLTIGVGYTF